MSTSHAKFASRIAAASMIGAAALHPAVAGECTTRSGAARNVLVELYTSEGCSSCPPADRWLSSLKPAAAEQRIVPVAFHVDYWDELGWRDAFADPRFTARQRAITSTLGGSYVYTPQVVVNGSDFGGRWRRGGSAPLIDAAQKPAGASIELTVGEEADAVTAHARVELPRDAAPRRLTLVVVATESALGSRVAAGENRGASLRHDFVARDIATFPLGAGREYRARFARKPGWKAADMRVVAFVQDHASGEVLQALSSCGAG